MKKMLIILSTSFLMLVIISLTSFKEVKAQTPNIVNFNVGITGTPNEQKYNELLTLYNDGYDRLNYIELDGVDATSEFEIAQITVYQVYDADNFQYVNEIRISQSNIIILRVSEIGYIFYSDVAYSQVQITLALSDRFQEGFEFGRSEYGINSGGIWYSASEWAIIVTEDLDNYYQGLLEAEYDRAVSDYGILINGQWLTAEQYGQIQYEKGLQDSDTTVDSMFTIITNGVFGPIALIFGLEIFPNISLGMIILVPLLFGLIAFVVGGKKK